MGLVLLVLAGFYGGKYVLRHLSTKLPLTGPTTTTSTPQEDLRREVEKVAEKIRAAHLNKDINKWLSCYHSSYPNLGRLENSILELWKNYDIKEVRYTITNVQRQGDRQASADLVWSIQVWDHRSHDYTLLRPSYKITLERGTDGWKIRDSKEEGGGSS
jgi:hypothetical protein